MKFSFSIFLSAGIFNSLSAGQIECCTAGHLRASNQCHLVVRNSSFARRMIMSGNQIPTKATIDLAGQVHRPDRTFARDNRIESRDLHIDFGDDGLPRILEEADIPLNMQISFPSLVGQRRAMFFDGARLALRLSMDARRRSGLHPLPLEVAADNADKNHAFVEAIGQGVICAAAHCSLREVAVVIATMSLNPHEIDNIADGMPEFLHEVVDWELEFFDPTPSSDESRPYEKKILRFLTDYFPEGYDKLYSILINQTSDVLGQRFNREQYAQAILRMIMGSVLFADSISIRDKELYRDLNKRLLLRSVAFDPVFSDYVDQISGRVHASSVKTLADAIFSFLGPHFDPRLAIIFNHRTLAGVYMVDSEKERAAGELGPESEILRSEINRILEMSRFHLFTGLRFNYFKTVDVMKMREILILYGDGFRDLLIKEGFWHEHVDFLHELDDLLGLDHSVRWVDNGGF